MRRVQVTEVLSRAEQGRTQPFLCRCDDEATYYVKGQSAGRKGLVAELICAQLATALGLPVPESVVADVPDELVSEATVSGPVLKELGPGPAFGSRVVQAVEFTNAHRDAVGRDLAERVAAFDWWIGNGDRTLTPLGGNVNLLWQVQPLDGLIVIDHNLAFTDFDRKLFLQTHVFAEQLERVRTDVDAQNLWVTRFSSALQRWPAIRDAIPREWHFIDAEQTLPSNLNVDSIKAMLDRCAEPDFWTLS